MRERAFPRGAVEVKAGRTSTMAEDLVERLARAGGEELETLVRAHGAELDTRAALQALRNPFVTTEVITRLLALPHLASSYEIQRQAARHPRTRQFDALRLVPNLFWRDLMEVGLETRVAPAVRRSARRLLLQKLPRLALGEKISLARRADGEILGQLRRDPSPRVIRALMENPRTTEGTLYPLVASESTPPAILDLVAGDRRWGCRHALRRGLCNNPRTPLQTALGLLPALRKMDLRAVVRNRRLSEPLRRRARLLLGEGGV